MKVTNLDLKKVENQGNLKAYATIILDDSLVIHNLKVIKGKKLFVAFPSQKGTDNKYRDIVYPILSDLRKSIESEILAKYND